MEFRILPLALERAWKPWSGCLASDMVMVSPSDDGHPCVLPGFLSSCWWESRSFSLVACMFRRVEKMQGHGRCSLGDEERRRPCSSFHLWAPSAPAQATQSYHLSYQVNLLTRLEGKVSELPATSWTAAHVSEGQCREPLVWGRCVPVLRGRAEFFLSLALS